MTLSEKFSKSQPQTAANIAFAQSPPGIGRKRPSLPGQPLGDRASAVPFGCRKCFPFASENHIQFSDLFCSIITHQSFSRFQHLGPTNSITLPLRASSELHTTQLFSTWTHREPAEPAGPNRSSPQLPAPSHFLDSSRRNPEAFSFFKDHSDISEIDEVKGRKMDWSAARTEANIVFAQSSMDRATLGPLSQPLGDCASAVPFGCRKYFPFVAIRMKTNLVGGLMARMQSNFPGRVANTSLAAGQGLIPLLEAVVNSIHSMSARPGSRRVTVTIFRNPDLLSADAHGNTEEPITSFTIKDNGIGFNDENIESFSTLDSSAKIAIGGKGVGRVYWLKAFSEAKISSIYLSSTGEKCRRDFAFRPSPDGVEDLEKSDELPETPVETTIELIGFKEAYRKASRKEHRAISELILDHCLAFLLLDSQLDIIVSDDASGTATSLRTTLNNDYIQKSQARNFEVKGQQFTLMDIFLRNRGGASHSLQSCAHNRVVMGSALSTDFPELPSPILKDGEAVVYSGYLSGSWLDSNVSQDRTSFTLDRRDQLPLNGGPTWEDVRERAVELIAELLSAERDASKKANVERIKSFIEHDEPRYRTLLGNRPDDIAKIPVTTSGNALDAKLHTILHDWKLELRIKSTEVLDEAAAKALAQETWETSFSADLSEVVAQLGESAQADLTEYVIYRSKIIKFLEQLLAATPDGKFPTEDKVHSLIFPMRKDSNQIDYSSHNLWLIDDRLAYHYFLSSDLPLVSHGGPSSVPSKDRPDLLIYNKRVAFTVDPDSLSSVVVVEFKRPERADYNEEENPIRQVYGYVHQIRSGTAKKLTAESIQALPIEVPFYCYIIASLTPRLEQELRFASFKRTPDGLGFSFYNEPMNAYVEVIPFRKLLGYAKKRNRAFFEKLNIRA